MSYHIYMFQELPLNCSRNSIRVQWPSCNAHWAFLLARHGQMVMTRSSNIHFSPQTPSFHKLTVHFQFISRGLVSRVTPIPFYPGVGRVWPCSFYSPTCRGLFCNITFTESNYPFRIQGWLSGIHFKSAWCLRWFPESYPSIVIGQLISQKNTNKSTVVML